jgi:hypothetical protein
MALYIMTQICFILYLLLTEIIMTITKAQFLKMKVSLGGDLWNQYKLCAIAFHKFPEAVQIEYNLGTGLWCDIKFIDVDGNEDSGRVYEFDSMGEEEK